MIRCQTITYKQKKSHFQFVLANAKFENKGITAVIGRNGAGKSTFLKLMAGIVKPTSGYFDYQGADVFQDYDKQKNNIHLLSGSINLFEDITTSEHLKLVKDITPNWNTDLEESLSEYFNLSPNVKVGQLSNGQKVKLKLLLSLCRGPKVILIDEITNDLDHETREFIYQALDEYTFENDAQVFVATNIIEDMERYASTVVLVKDGTVSLNKNLDELKSELGKNLEQIYKEQFA